MNAGDRLNIENANRAIFIAQHIDTITYFKNKEQSYRNHAFPDLKRAAWIAVRRTPDEKCEIRFEEQSITLRKTNFADHVHSYSSMSLPGSVLWMDAAPDLKYFAIMYTLPLSSERKLCWTSFDDSGDYFELSGNFLPRVYWTPSSLVVARLHSDGTVEQIDCISIEKGDTTALKHFPKGTRLEMFPSSDMNHLLISTTMIDKQKVAYSLDLTTSKSFLCEIASFSRGTSFRLRGNTLWSLAPGAKFLTSTVLGEDSSRKVALPSSFYGRYIEDAGPFLAVVGRSGGSASCLAVVDDQLTETISVPSTGAVRVIPGKYEDKFAKIAVSSIDMPRTIMRIDRRGNVQRSVSSNPGFTNHSHINKTRIKVTSFDGVDVPVTLFYSGTLDSPRPCVAHVYGCYGIPLEPPYDPSITPLLDCGVVYALCHVRGGGENGHYWHSAGMREGKLASIFDYLCCVHKLGRLDYISREMIVAQSASAGGFVAAAAVGIHPHLFYGLHLVNPFLDVIGETMHPQNSRGFTDRTEFGDPYDDPSLRSIQDMSWPERWELTNPLTKLHVLVESRFQDQVVSWEEVLRWISSLRRRACNMRVNLMLLCNFTDGDHHAESGNRYGGSLRNSWIMDIFSRRKQIGR